MGDEVFPGIIVGNGECIKDLDYMLDLGVTHIINCAEQDVRMDPTKFAKQGICYKGLSARTFPQLPSPTSSRIAPTSSRGLSACVVDSFSSAATWETVVAPRSRPPT